MSFLRSVSFSGAGFLGSYHLGAASCLLKRKAIDANTQLVGSSAGALVSAAIAGKGLQGIDDGMIMLGRMAETTRQQPLSSLTRGFSLVDQLEPLLATVLAGCDPGEFNGRLHVVVTSFHNAEIPGGRRQVISQFESTAHVQAACLLSAYIPFFTGPLRPGFQQPGSAAGRASVLVGNFVDGGMSDQFPVLDAQTVSVSPFAGRFGTDFVCPPSAYADADAALRVPWHRDGAPGGSGGWRVSIEASRANLRAGYHAIFAPAPEELEQLYRRGHDDAAAWLDGRARRP
jgi:hypothetical protein